MEEQDMEVQALEAIFMDEFILSSPGPPAMFRITLSPFAPHEEDAEHVNYVKVVLLVEYSETYPEQLPLVLKVNNVLGLSEDQLMELQAVIEEQANILLDTPMVYSLAEIVKEWLKEHNKKQLSAHEQAVQRKLKNTTENGPSDAGQIISEIEKNARYEEISSGGTLFSIDLFNEWKVHFETELLAKEQIEAEAGLDPEAFHRISGRQFFENRAAMQTASFGGQEEIKYFDRSLYEDEDIPEE